MTAQPPCVPCSAGLRGCPRAHTSSRRRMGTLVHPPPRRTAGHVRPHVSLHLLLRRSSPCTLAPLGHPHPMEKCRFLSRTRRPPRAPARGERARVQSRFCDPTVLWLRIAVSIAHRAIGSGLLSFSSRHVCTPTRRGAFVSLTEDWAEPPVTGEMAARLRIPLHLLLPALLSPPPPPSPLLLSVLLTPTFSFHRVPPGAAVPPRCV